MTDASRPSTVLPYPRFPASCVSYEWTPKDFDMEVPNAKGEYWTWKGGTRAKECYAAFRSKWPDPRHVFAAVGAWSDGLALTKMGRVTGHPTIITSMNLPWSLRYTPRCRVRQSCSQ
jgi:hypothetical protein